MTRLPIGIITFSYGFYALSFVTTYGRAADVFREPYNNRVFGNGARFFVCFFFEPGTTLKTPHYVSLAMCRFPSASHVQHVVSRHLDPCTTVRRGHATYRVQQHGRLDTCTRQQRLLRFRCSSVIFAAQRRRNHRPRTDRTQSLGF